MHVHAAHDKAAADAGEIVGERVIAVLVRVQLAGGLGERVRGGGDGGEAVGCGFAGDGGAQVQEIGARLGNGGARAGADLDLRAQELGADLAAELCLACSHHGGRRLGDEVARGAIDEVVFLLDADGEFWLGERHGAMLGTRGRERQWRWIAVPSFVLSSDGCAAMYRDISSAARATCYIMMPASLPPSTVIAAPVTNVD